MRFGDGDVYLAAGKKDMLQLPSAVLSGEMKEAFLLKGEHIFKALAIHSDRYNREQEMFVGNLMHCDYTNDYIIRLCYPYFTGHRIYSAVALHYMAAYHPDVTNDFLRFLKSKTVLFIGNETIKPEVIETLFGNVSHIKTAGKNAYDGIDTIESEAIELLQRQTDFGVVIVAMGCSGRVLMKRLMHQRFPVFYFDFGSLLDGICGNITRPWLKQKIEYEKLLQNL